MPLGIVATSSQYAIRSIHQGERSLFQTTQRLATGRKINTGKDDPAALISSEQLAAEIAALEAETKANDRNQAYANIADGHLAGLGDLLNDLNGLIVSSANTAGLTDAEVQANQQQIDSIVSSVHRFLGDSINSLDGLNLPNDGNATLRDALTAAAGELSSLVSGGANSLASGHLEDAQSAVANALSAVVNARGTIGSYQKNTLETHGNSLESSRIALIDSHSRLVDTDYAEESTKLVQQQTLLAAKYKVLKITNDSAGLILDLFS